MWLDNEIPSIEEIKKRYPKRNLAETAEVVRVAPSPTGFAHFGFLYMSLINERLAHCSNGVFILRLEDTDQKREVKGAAELLIKSLDRFSVEYDEGPILEGNIIKEKGLYGPYIQSKRTQVYQSFAKHMLTNGQAYLAFESNDELNTLREIQEKEKVQTGYYGKWAKWRTSTKQQIEDQIALATPYVVRFKNTKPANYKITINDLALGEVSFNADQCDDYVLLKSDGLPTYHFAHFIDDYLMQVTIVVRGYEWLASVPKHVLLAECFDLKPTYAHLPPIEKTDGAGRRKLSKRKDPEADLTFYYDFKDEEGTRVGGFEPEAVNAYLMNLVVPEYENKAKEQNTIFIPNFELKRTNLRSGAGALFDIKKLENINAELVSKMTAQQVYEKLTAWAKRCDQEFLRILESNSEYTMRILSIERGGDKPRKDFTKWTDARKVLGFFYDELYEHFQKDWSAVSHVPTNIRQKVLKDFLAKYNETDTQETWLEKLKTVAKENKFSFSKSEAADQTNQFNGTWRDVPAILRIALTGANFSPDLYTCFKVMGVARITARINGVVQ